MRRRKPTRFIDCVGSKSFVGTLHGATAEEVVRELASALARSHDRLIPDDASRAVLDRERIMPTGLANGVAVPHARLPNLDRPLIAAGVARQGVDFRAHDGQPSRLIFLVLTPEGQAESQLELLADIARIFSDKAVARAAVECRSFTEFLAILNTGAPPTPHAAPHAVATGPR